VGSAIPGATRWSCACETRNALEHAEETVYDTDVIDAQVQSRLYGEYADYFERLHVVSISEGLIAMRRRSAVASGPGENWVRFEELPPRPPEPFGDAVWRMFETRDALDRMKDDRGLLESKPRMAPGLALETTRNLDGRGVERRRLPASAERRLPVPGFGGRPRG